MTTALTYDPVPVVCPLNHVHVVPIQADKVETLRRHGFREFEFRSCPLSPRLTFEGQRCPNCGARLSNRACCAYPLDD